MRILVEDDTRSFPYLLLKRYFGDNIYGACGNDNIVSVLSDLQEDVVVFIDVSADNHETITAYKNAVNKAKELSNVFVIPIPSIEYLFIRAFIGYSYTEFKTVLTFGNYKEVGHSTLRRRKLNTYNFENYCKSTVNNHMSCYYKRIFEKQNCICDKYQINDCRELSIDEKSMRMALSLPVFLNNNEIYSEDLKSRIQLAILKGEYLYNKMALNYLNYKIITTHSELQENII